MFSLQGGVVTELKGAQKLHEMFICQTGPNLCQKTELIVKKALKKHNAMDDQGTGKVNRISLYTHLIQVFMMRLLHHFLRALLAIDLCNIIGVEK